MFNFVRQPLTADETQGAKGPFPQAGLNVHLLNLTVAPDVQGRGHGRHLLSVLVELCRSEAAHSLWLEVRQSNQRAQSVYDQFGFRACGLRKGYYPAAQGRREDAVVMSLDIASVSARACNEVE